ncbi:MAG TPA: hypothetical protein VF221_11835 [Chloroflexota bacterium]
MERLDAESDPIGVYERIAEELTAGGAIRGAMFGMPCLKFGRKAFAGYFHGDMVFKLRGPAHARALALPGARLFDPSARGRPMKVWVQVPGACSSEWLDLGRDALDTGVQDS